MTNCIDEYARESIAKHEEECATRQGEVLAELGRVSSSLHLLQDGMMAMHERVRQLSAHLKAPAFVRHDANGKAPSPSFHGLVEEVTGSHAMHSLHPVRAVLERGVGKIVIRVAVFVAVVGATLLTEHWILSIVHK
jgi:hypothetical protein